MLSDSERLPGIDRLDGRGGSNEKLQKARTAEFVWTMPSVGKILEKCVTVTNAGRKVCIYDGRKIVATHLLAYVCANPPGKLWERGVVLLW